MQDASIGIRADFDGAEAERKIKSFANRSTIALNNLSLVIQDLPYGFRGIQNNLPALLQSFTQLDTKGKSLTDVFKEFGSALKIAGPFLAFSAITAGIDVAIAKYGSLDNAIKALLSNSAKLVEVQNNLNKAFATAQGETAGESAKIEILTRTLTDLSQPMDKRYAAYVELKKISPDIVAGIRDENSLTEASVKLIEQNAKARLDYLQLRAKEFAITQQLNKLESEYLELQQEYPSLLSAKQKAQKEYDAVANKGYDATATFMAITAKKELTTLNASKYAFDENRKKRTEIYNITQGLIEQLDPLVQGIAQYDANTKNLTDSLSNQIAAEKERNKNTKEYLKNLQEIKYRLSFSLREDPLVTDETKKNLKEASKGLKEFQLDVLDKKAVGPGKLAPNYSNEVQQIILENELFKKKFLETRMFLQEAVFQPLTDVFETFFEKGTAGFKEMGKIILAQIRKLAAQIIATGIVQLVASLINPIGAVAASGPKALDLFSILGNAAKSVLSGAVNRPSFAGVQGGGLTMGGRVSVVLRGQDLIGAINRTNLQIERLG